MEINAYLVVVGHKGYLIAIYVPYQVIPIIVINVKKDIV